ncbi:MAG: flagellar biosynthesis anti-sigma factor FlgM [Gammaproteobacteria bacterium]|nr:MAG: flagellar biosynthesis anti-sigma factor FlgM [Pseudomonadota bacterium]PIE38005.1 MAG: flagellar biosynthesis anti-sigma factor FlgM [Gammaproteobacteria bacterium]
MIIDFNGIDPNSGSSQKSKQASQATESKIHTTAESKAKGTVATGSNAGDSVSFSAKAQSFQQLENSIKDMPDINNDKVSEIKAAIDNGSYSVDEKKLAQNMLDFDSGMF